MRTNRWYLGIAAVLLLALGTVACGGDDGDDAGGSEESGAEYATIRVPEDHETIQGRRRRAPGDLVLISPALPRGRRSLSRTHDPRHGL